MPYATIEEGSFDRSEVAICAIEGLQLRRAWIADMAGKRLSPDLPVAVPNTVLLHPSESIAAVISQEKKLLHFVDWRTSKVLETHKLPDYSNYATFGPRNALLVSCTNGRLCQFGPDQSKSLARLEKVTMVCYDSNTGRTVVQIKRKPRHYVIGRIDNEMIVENLYVSTSGVSYAATGPNWIALTESESGSLTVIDLDGRILWRYESPEPYVEIAKGMQPQSLFYFGHVSPSSDFEQIVAARRGTTEETARVSMMKFDARSGELLATEAAPAETIFPVCIDGGRTWVDGVGGRFDVSSFKWHAVNWLQGA